MASLLSLSKSFSGLMLVLFYIADTSNDYVYSLNPPRVTDLGNLNFEASWDPIENYTGMYNLTSEFGKKNLCYTNATSCFLGGKLLEDKRCPLTSLLAVTLKADGRESDKWIFDSDFRVGPPNILSPDIVIDSTNITIVIQGAQTPLYYDYRYRKCRGESWEGEKSPIYMGQRVSKDGVECKYNLTDAYGSRANHEIKNYIGELNEYNGKLHIFLRKLTPFSNYSIVIWCTLNYEDGESTVYNFTTKEDVPSSGPTIVNTSSEGLECDKPDLRNITFTIQPPPEDQRHGILQFYEICYRVVSSNPDEEWHSEILNLPSPPPDSNIVTLKDTSRWDAYEVKVFANNSVGGMSSSVYQFEVLKSNPSPIESVSYTSTAHSLRFVWEEPSCESLHGVFDRYEYELYDLTGGGRYVRYRTPIRRKDVQITGLDACTEYRFRIRVVTTQLRRSDWHMEMAMTNISAPGMPVITELTQYQVNSVTTGLTVSWQPPSSPPCQPTQYEIEYYVLQGDMCEDTPSDRIMTSAGTVNGSTFTFNVLELRPNSEYRVFVGGRTSSGYGDWDSRAATTGYSYPTGSPTYIQSASIKKRSIVFSWEKPECGHRNGPITRNEVMLSNYTGNVVYHGNVSGPEHEIFGLIPYSNYSIRIRAWNYELAGEYGPAIWAQTDEASPNQPIGVNLPSSDQESITVEWMSPNPPLGRIIGYFILYWETFGNSSTPRNISISCRDGLCSDINYRFSTVIPDLQPDINYSVQVMAETIHGVGDSSPDPPVVRITSEGRPACIQALRVSSSITTVVVSWELSSSQCSPDYYIIRYSLLQKLACQSPETIPTEFEVNTNVTQYNNLVGLEPYSRYKISVIAVNGAGQSEPTIGYSDTRPGSPSNITNVRVNPERTSPTRLGFTWQPLNCRNVNGVFWYYYPRIYKDGDRSNPAARRIYLDDDISYSSIEFNDLEACTIYELRINAGNQAPWNSGNVSYAIGVTGVTFTSASAYATGSQLRVQWSVPSQCNVDYYRLSYQLISREACQDVPIIDAPVYELNVTSVSTDVYKYISNLEYYATYSISIIAVIWRTESPPMNVSGDTLAGDPTGFPTNIRSTSTNKRSIVFTWETPDCGNRNGPISSYEVMLSNSTGDVVYHGNVSASAEPEHEIFELIPSSNYSIRIRAWNYELAGEYGPAIWVQTD